MGGIETPLVAPLERRVTGNESAGLEDADLIGKNMNVEDAAARRVRHAVEIAADAHHAFVGDPPFEFENRPIRGERQGLQGRLFLGEGLVDDALRGCVHARIGDRVEPMPQLGVEIVEVAKGAAEEEVLADVTKRPFHLAFRFWPVRPASAWLEAIVPGEIDKRAIIDDEAVGVLADDRGLHAIIEDLTRRTADRLESGDMTAQDALQVLVNDEAAPDKPGVAEHHGKQPNDALDAGIVGKLHLEMGEVDLRLPARRRFEAHFETGRARRPQIPHAVSENAVAARVSALLDLAPQTHRREAGIGRQALLQIRLERIGDPRPRRPCFVFRRLQPLGDGATNGLPIDAEVAGNGGNRQALSMKIQNHHEFPEFDHRAAPSRQREQHRRVGRRRACQGSFWKARHYENWGIFKCHFWGELIRR
jgi:hypothetical protein